MQVRWFSFWLACYALAVADTQASANDDKAKNQPAPTIQKSRVLSLHKQSTAAVCFSAKGLLATSSMDRSAKLWDVKQQRTVATLTGLPAIKEGTWDSDVAFSPDGRLFAVALSGKSIRVWTTDGYREQWRTDSGARSLAFAPNGKALVTADWEDPQIKVWDVATGKILKTLNGTDETVKKGCWSQGSVAYSPDGQTFASAVGGADQGAKFPTELRIWDASTLSIQQKFVAQSFRVHAMEYSPDGKTIAVGGVRGAVRLFQFSVKPKALTKVDEAVIKRLIADLDNIKFATRQNAQRQLTKLGLAAEKALKEAKRTSKSRGVQSRVNAILQALVKATEYKMVTLRGHRGTIMGLSYSPDGALLASCSREYGKGAGRIIVWETQALSKPVFEWDGSGVTSIRFSPDGGLMASSAQDGSVTLWTIKR